MKRIFLILTMLFLCSPVFAADTKISDLTEDTTPASGDYTVTVDRSAGTNKKVTLGNSINAVSPTFYVNGTTGNVGIGTNSPATKLNVSGNIIVSGVGTFGSMNVTGNSTFGGTISVGGVTANSTSIDNTSKVTAGTNPGHLHTANWSKGIAFESPTTTTDFLFGSVTGAAVTYTSIYCYTYGGSVTVDVTTAGSSINGSAITCTTSGVLDSSLGGDTSGALADALSIDVTGVATGATYLMIQTNGTQATN